VGAGKTTRPHSVLVGLLFVSILFEFALIGCGAGGASTSTTPTTETKPVLSLSQTTVAFGSVTTGKSASQPLTLRNTGTAPLTVSAITASGGGFSVSGFNLPMTIAPGASVSGTVIFAPSSVGSATGSVTIASDSSAAVAPVALTATAITASPQLVLSPTSMAFGSVTTGQTSSQQLTIRNSGTATLHVTALAAAGTGFSVNGFLLPLSLASGTTAVGNVVFSPTSTGATSGSVTVTSDSEGAVPPVALSGTGTAGTPKISVSPTSVAFGNVTVGQTGTTPVTLQNTGTANLNVTAISATGTGYSVNGFILPLTLAPGASGTGNVVFAPKAAGAVNGSLTVASNSSSAAPTVSLTGSGVAAATYLLSVSPTSLAFGTKDVASTNSLNVTLSNTGMGSVSVSAANVTGTGYSVGTSFPVTIAAGATRTVAVTFTPQLTGAANGSVSFVSNATNSPANVTMTGAGQAAAQHAVDLTWTASTSSVSGYNVYRSTTSGGPYTLLNSYPLTGTSHTDSTVLSGNTYYFVVRSVSATGMESANSTEVSAQIP
jgi:hypothetical protein